jgi:hypothetical protein
VKENVRDEKSMPLSPCEYIIVPSLSVKAIAEACGNNFVHKSDNILRIQLKRGDLCETIFVPFFNQCSSILCKNAARILWPIAKDTL